MICKKFVFDRINREDIGPRDMYCFFSCFNGHGAGNYFETRQQQTIRMVELFLQI